MKILHFSDTHLGFNIENTKRDDDFYNNFEKVIDDIIEKKIDLVIHSGDLFHTPKPSNKAISITLKNFLKLEKENIPVLIIAGNHDTPRVSNITHVFEIFKHLKNFYVFYKQNIENIIINGINFVLLPHIHNENIFKNEFKKSENLIKKDAINIFVSHFGISVSNYDEYTDEISGINIKKEDLELLKKFDYVALGHYHNNFSIGKNIHYSGSIEHTSFNGKNHKVGYNIFDTKTKTKETNIIKTRNIIDFKDIDCSGFLNTDEIILHLKDNINQNDINDNIIKVNFKNISKKLLFEFEDRKIKEFFKDAFYFEYKKVLKPDENNLNNKDINFTQNTNFIQTNFSSFFKEYKLDDKTIKKEEIEKEILDLIKTIG